MKLSTRLWRSRKAPLFHHDVAQQYELGHGRSFIETQYRGIWDAVTDAAAGQRDPVGPYRRVWFDEFFSADDREWASFMTHIEGRAVLDIGGGPAPVNVLWPWAGSRLVVDPLAQKYSAAVRDVTGRSWFDDLEIIGEPAETFIPSLKGRVDGAIICRNMLDHTAEPYLVLANIAAYAARGCRLLLWTDLHHLGYRDEGHSDITRDTDGFRRLIEQLGFAIVREVPHHPGRGTIEFGCFAERA